MKLGVLKSLGHNLADSLASGIGLMIGVYSMDVFAEAQTEEGGFIVIDFLAGETRSEKASEGLRRAVRRYRDELPSLCAKHGVEPQNLKRLEAKFGTDPVYGPHFTVTVGDQLGRVSTDRYVGIPGRRLRTRR